MLIYNKSALLCRVTSILTFSDNREERSLLTVSPATENTLSEGADEADDMNDARINSYTISR